MKKLMYLGAEWCGPCKVIKPQLKQSGLDITFVDVDQQPDIAAKYSIRSIPTILALEGDKMVGKLVGTTITVDAVKQLLK
jgi:thioredoxin 1